MKALLERYDEKEIALAIHLGEITNEMMEKLDEIDENNMTQEQEEFVAEIEDIMYEVEEKINDGDYLVGTNDEMNEEWLEYVENAMDDYLPEVINKYGYKSISFDENGNIECKMSIDLTDRASDLASYDGYENTEEVNGTTYFIYRRN